MVRSAELEGYCIDLLKALAAMLHFSYKVKVVGDGQYGAVSSNGNWTGMIGEILRRVIFNFYFQQTAALEGKSSASGSWLH